MSIFSLSIAPEPQTLALLNAILKEVQTMAGRFDELKSALAEEKSATQAAIALIHDLAAKVDAAAGDPAELAAITSDARATAASLAAAVMQGTPAQEEQQAQTGNAPPVPGTPVAEAMVPPAPATADTVPGGNA